MSAKKLLFVDDDVGFLETISQVFQVWSGGDLEVVCASSPGKAIQSLQTQPFDLIVLDVQMPVVDGVQFLQLLQRKLPDLQKVALTGYPDDSTRASCLNAGASMFLGKPRTAQELESVYHALHALVMIEPQEGFRGTLNRVGLHDVLQMEAASGKSSVLEIRAGKRSGRIFICHGAVIHAAVDDLKGPEAFYKLMTMPGGDFRFLPFQTPPETSIHTSLTGLLLEAAHRQDQTVAAPTTASPAALLVPAPEEAPRPEPRAIPAVPSAPAVADPVLGARAAMLPSEVVVCDAAAEITFAWQAADADLRGALLEFVRMKGAALTRAVAALGALKRVEIQGMERHAIVLLERERSLFAGAERGGLDVSALSDFLVRDLAGFIAAHPGE